MAGVKVHFDVRLDGLDRLGRKVTSSEDKIDHGVAVQIAKDTSPYVPADSLELDRRTRVVARYIIYPGPSARMLNAGKVMVDAETGKGPAHFIDDKGNEVIKFRRGATLKATSRDLEFDKSVHRKATDHWFEASKRDNIDKWERVTKRLILTYGRG